MQTGAIPTHLFKWLQILIFSAISEKENEVYHPLTLSIATDLAVIDFGKVIEQATKFHLLKIQTRQKFSPLTEHESVPCEWQEGFAA